MVDSLADSLRRQGVKLEAEATLPQAPSGYKWMASYDGWKLGGVPGAPLVGRTPSQVRNMQSVPDNGDESMDDADLAMPSIGAGGMVAGGSQGLGSGMSDASDQPAGEFGGEASYQMYTNDTVLKIESDGTLHVYRIDPKNADGVQYASIAKVGETPNFSRNTVSLGGLLADKTVLAMLRGQTPKTGHRMIGATVLGAAGWFLIGGFIPTTAAIMTGWWLGGKLKTARHDVDMTPKY